MIPQVFCARNFNLHSKVFDAWIYMRVWQPTVFIVIQCTSSEYCAAISCILHQQKQCQHTENVLDYLPIQKASHSNVSFVSARQQTNNCVWWLAIMGITAEFQIKLGTMNSWKLYRYHTVFMYLLYIRELKILKVNGACRHIVDKISNWSVLENVWDTQTHFDTK